MNYRHAYHAGNAADCLKHALLHWLVLAMARKPTPFLVLDTHAGAGRTDLQGAAALRTGEAAGGILRLLDDPPAALTPYVETVRSLGLYPGSPALIRAWLRPGDRLVATELHEGAHAALRRLFAADHQVAVHRRDGYAALAAFLPPPERRGLILLDPPYEQPDELATLASALRTGLARFRNGVFAAWYPIKGRAPVRAFEAALAGLPDIVAAELLVRAPTDPARLNGSGLLVINPPYGFEAAASAILAALLSRLGEDDRGAGIELRRLAGE